MYSPLSVNLPVNLPSSLPETAHSVLMYLQGGHPSDILRHMQPGVISAKRVKLRRAFETEPHRGSSTTIRTMFLWVR